MEQFANEECEDFYMCCLQRAPNDPEILQLAKDPAFLRFVVQFDMRKVFEAIGAPRFPDECMYVAIRHKRTYLFHRMFVHSAIHAALHADPPLQGLVRAAGRLLLHACREGAAGIVDVLLRYSNMPRTLVEDGKNCVHHLLSNRMYQQMNKFLDVREVWSLDIQEQLVLQAHRYFLKELKRRGTLHQYVQIG